MERQSLSRTGRISSTIAAARQAVAASDMQYKPASLLDPSRPYTPALPRQSTPFSMLSQEEQTKRHKEEWPVFHTEEDWRPGTPTTARGGSAMGHRPMSGHLKGRGHTPDIMVLDDEKGRRPGSGRPTSRSKKERPWSGKEKKKKKAAPPSDTMAPPPDRPPTQAPPSRPPSGSRRDPRRPRTGSAGRTPRTGSAGRTKRSIAPDLAIMKEKLDAGTANTNALSKEAAELIKVCRVGNELVTLCALVLKLPFTRDTSTVHQKCCEKIFTMSKETLLDKALADMIELLLKVLDEGDDRGFKSVCYVLGALRNLSLEEANSESIVSAGGIARISRLLDEKVYTELSTGQPNPDSTTEQLLVEVCGVLRNLAIVKNKQKLFLKENCLRRLCLLMGRFSEHPQMMLNVCRILSKLSLNKGCRDLISDPQHLRSMMKMLQQHNTKLALCIRVCFTLGNLTVSNDRNRTEISDKCDGVTVLLEILKRNCDRDLRIITYKKRKNNDENKEESKDYKKAMAMDREISDMLVKLIRVIANLSINRRIGAMFSKEPNISSLVDLLQRKNLEEHEELVLNIISAITNLSFYHQISSQNARDVTLPLVDNNKDILACLIPHLFSQNSEVVVESVRALGNFSREANFRDYMRSSRVDETLVVLLDHSDPKVVYGVCGVLLNIAADTTGHAVFFEKDCAGVDRIISVLTRFGLEDYGLTDVVCKAFLNLCSASATPLPPRHRQRLVHLLTQIKDHLGREAEELHMDLKSEDEDDIEAIEAALDENNSLSQVVNRLLDVQQAVSTTKTQ